MQQQVFEGTWEELIEHAAEFSDRLLRIILIDADRSCREASTVEPPAHRGGFRFGIL